MSALKRFCPIMLILLGGCDTGPAEAEAWVAPSEVAGKADGIGVLQGSDIPTDLVDPDAQYMFDRSIASLQEIPGIPRSGDLQIAHLARSADFRGNGDGRVDVEELVALEPLVHELSSDEVEPEVLVPLWELLVVPDGAAETVEFFVPEPLLFEDRTPSPADYTQAPRIAVTAPGLIEEEGKAGSIVFEHEITTTLEEVRRYEFGALKKFQNYMDLNRVTVTWPVLGEDQLLLLIPQSDREDQIVGPEVRDSVPAGDYLAEIWEDGERVDVFWVKLPTLGERNENIGLTDRVLHAYESIAGQPLVQNVRSAEVGAFSGNTIYRADFTWDLGPEEPTGVVEDEALDGSAPLVTDLETGSYMLQAETGGTVELEVFKTGAIRFTNNATSIWSVFNGAYRSADTDDAYHQVVLATTWSARFNQLTHVVRARLSGQQFTMEVLPEHRQP